MVQRRRFSAEYKREASTPFSIRPYRRFPMQYAVTYNAGPFFTLPLAFFFGFGSC
jgi:hypothetical protein